MKQVVPCRPALGAAGNRELREKAGTDSACLHLFRSECNTGKLVLGVAFDPPPLALTWKLISVLVIGRIAQALDVAQCELGTANPSTICQSVVAGPSIWKLLSMLGR